MKGKLGEKVKHKGYHITQASPLPDIYIPWKSGNTVHTKTRRQMFIATLVTKVKKWRWSKCPATDEWIDKIVISIQRNII